MKKSMSRGVQLPKWFIDSYVSELSGLELKICILIYSSSQNKTQMSLISNKKIADILKVRSIFRIKRAIQKLVKIGLVKRCMNARNSERTLRIPYSSPSLKLKKHEDRRLFAFCYSVVKDARIPERSRRRLAERIYFTYCKKMLSPALKFQAYLKMGLSDEKATLVLRREMLPANSPPSSSYSLTPRSLSVAANN